MNNIEYYRKYKRSQDIAWLHADRILSETIRCYMIIKLFGLFETANIIYDQEKIYD